MGKILLIEDDNVAKKLIGKLNKRHTVECAYSYASAIGLWKEAEEDKESFNCIILDLNINPNGLSDEDIDKYFPVHGILILDAICNLRTLDGNEKYTEKEKKDIWNKTTVYSAYIDRLLDNKSNFKYFDHLELVSKQEPTSISDLLDTVNEKLENKNADYE